MSVEVTSWARAEASDAEALLGELRASGREYVVWGNGPGDTYAVHTHSYRKHLVCLSGSIRFTLPQTGEICLAPTEPTAGAAGNAPTTTGEAVELTAGDALDLPAGTAHGAIVGPHGVRCAEAHISM